LNFKFLNNKILKPKRVVIFGSSGIISKNLQIRLQKDKINFIVFGKAEINLKKKKSEKMIKKMIKKNDTIIFISAEAPVKNHEMLMNNIIMCENICNGLKNSSINQLIYISSDAVYEDAKNSITEKTNASPTSLHGLMHLIRETMLKKYFNSKLCILRPTLIYGVGDTHLGYGPNRFLKLSLKNIDLNIFGNGEERRDHILVDNIIDIMIKCINKKGVGNLNLATGKVISFMNIAKIILGMLNSKSKIKKIKRMGPMPHNGYRAFNIRSIKKNFKEVYISNILEGLEIYLYKLKKYND
tara:strand:- start:1297 stop:2190 length:894 start_codon:yes stop_codon:yes gene_type:complete